MKIYEAVIGLAILLLAVVCAIQQNTIETLKANQFVLTIAYKQSVDDWATVLRIQNTWLDVTSSQQSRMQLLDKRVDFCLGITESPGYKYVRGAEDD
jgi:hypothetical protein